MGVSIHCTDEATAHRLVRAGASDKRRVNLEVGQTVTVA